MIPSPYKQAGAALLLTLSALALAGCGGSNRYTGEGEGFDYPQVTLESTTPVPLTSSGGLTRFQLSILLKGDTHLNPPADKPTFTVSQASDTSTAFDTHEKSVVANQTLTPTENHLPADVDPAFAVNLYTFTGDVTLPANTGNQARTYHLQVFVPRPHGSSYTQTFDLSEVPGK